MLISKKFRFESAHKLEDYKGKCENLHGHSYVLHVTIEGNIEKHGMVLDFHELKDLVNKYIIDRLDHTFLNDLVPVSTCENIAVWIWNELASCLKLHEVKLFETEDSWVIYRGK